MGIGKEETDWPEVAGLEKDGLDTTNATPMGSATADNKSLKDDSVSVRTAATVLQKTSWWLEHSVFSHVWSPQILILWIVTGIVVVLYGLMYLGPTMDPLSYLHRAPVAIVNNDAGYTTLSSLTNEAAALVNSLTRGIPMGTVFTQGLLGNDAIRSRLAWYNATGITHDSAIAQVDSGDYWGIIYIPSNFSDNFVTNLNLNTSTPVAQTQMSMEYIFDQGRSFTISNFINQIVTASVTGVTNGLALSLANSTASQPALVKPAFYINPVYLASGRMHPVIKFGYNLATYIVLLLMWLGSMMSVTVIHKLFIAKIPHLTGVKVAEGLPPARFSSQQIVAASFLLGLAFSLFHAFLAWCILYGLGGSEAFQGGSPVICGVDGLAVPASLLLIFQIVSSGGIVDHIAMPGFMKLGYAFPFFWGLHAMKAYMFGSLVNELYKSYLVLAAWAVGATILAMVIGSLKVSKWRNTKLASEAQEALTVLGGTMRAV
ncbi:hypothetical protein PhCBS80983_g03567 [Powellomyces hirtus]|uniref:DUF3533 domain-containing protein n=1 Tax=Powellomyces hirtus TaxID=109895 RepID=A0A507E3U8_9FUNG|nr:hypothetical protein PhCBS80983_g03567 [Powellomyces hirtus]